MIRRKVKTVSLKSLKVRGTLRKLIARKFLAGNILVEKAAVAGKGDHNQD